MKRFLIIIVLFVTVNSYAQLPTRVTTSKITDKTVVKGEDGTIYPYTIWSKLVQTGQYSLRPALGDEFLLVKLTPEQAARNLEMKKKAALNMPKPYSSAAFVEGEKFRAEKFTSIDKIKFDPKTSTDKIYVINFWFINCEPCKREIPELNELVKQYKDNKDVVFLAVALDDTFDLKKFLKTTPFDYNIIPNGKFYSQKYGVNGYPTHVIVGKDGIIKFSTMGLAGNTVSWIGKVIKEQL